MLISTRITFACLALSAVGWLALTWINGATMSVDAVERGAHAKPLTVLELFTSEGCSSCPSADRILKAIADQGDNAKSRVIVLSWHVDYWNYLGWRDPYSSAIASSRQRRYARRLGTTVFTPQLIVNGNLSAVGSRPREVDAAIRKSRQIPASSLSVSSVRLSEGKLTATVEFLGAQPGDTLLVCLIQRSGEVDVQKGENAGRTLTHVNIVRSVVEKRIAEFGGRETVELTVPPGINATNFSLVTLIQGRTGRISAASELPGNLTELGRLTRDASDD